VFKFVGIYFILISVLIYFLWLSEIISSNYNHTIPKTLIDTGLFHKRSTGIRFSSHFTSNIYCGNIRAERQTIWNCISTCYSYIFCIDGYYNWIPGDCYEYARIGNKLYAYNCNEYLDVN
jgi:hypothetical protein